MMGISFRRLIEWWVYYEAKGASATIEEVLAFLGTSPQGQYDPPNVPASLLGWGFE
jgi:hypothetical protein